MPHLTLAHCPSRGQHVRYAICGVLVMLLLALLWFPGACTRLHGAIPHPRACCVMRLPGKGTSSASASGAGAGGGDAPAASSGSSGKLHIVVKLTEELLHTYKDINKVRLQAGRTVLRVVPGSERACSARGWTRVQGLCCTECSRVVSYCGLWGAGALWHSQKYYEKKRKRQAEAAKQKSGDRCVQRGCALSWGVGHGATRAAP